MHWMRKLVILCLVTEEEAFLAHVKVETLQASVAESDDWVLLANVAFSLMLSVL